jgi:hypothetical protein
MYNVNVNAILTLCIPWDTFHLQAETCSIEIPSLELEVGAGTLGGKFTTLEGRA